MIEVRIRRASEVRARYLCTWPATDLDTLIPTVEAWGLEGDVADVSGQFVLDPAEAYFELIVDDGEVLSS